MGLQTSKTSTLMVGDTLDLRYDIYKIKRLSGIEYFKCDDLADFNIKFVLLMISNFLMQLSLISLKWKQTANPS